MTIQGFCLHALRGQPASCRLMRRCLCTGLPRPSLQAATQVLWQLLAWQAPEGEIKDTLSSFTFFLRAGLKVLHFRGTSAIWAVAQSELKSCVSMTWARLFRSEQTLTSASSMDQAWIMTHKPKAFVDSSKSEKSYCSSVAAAWQIMYRDSHYSQKVQKQSLGERKEVIWLSPLWPNTINQGIGFA